MSILDFAPGIKKFVDRVAGRRKAPASRRLPPAAIPAPSPEEAADTWFARLRDLAVMEFGGAPFERNAQGYLLETGMLDSERPYLYLQPLNQSGFLFERGGTGWVIARADKIVAKDTFMRAGEFWDVVNVVASPIPGGMPKVSSHRFKDQLMPFSEYRRRLVEAIRCAA
ncbi:MAG: hypothetical protein RIQ81_1616 [Pseudomonadota bacterium]|jgi:hypothetical protein